MASASAASEPVALALAALCNSVQSSSELQNLLLQEKDMKIQKRAVAKQIKKERRKEKQLRKSMSKLDAKDVLQFLARKLSQHSGDGADAGASA